MPLHSYNLYGLCVRSEWELPCRTADKLGSFHLELTEGSPLLFLNARTEAGPACEPSQWFHWAQLRDGSTYLRWAELFEFLVSADGCRITGLPLAQSSVESFLTYLLGQVLSFALLKQGVEPLHATVIAVDGGAVAFVGDSGFGKSSMGAAFLQAGHRLLTDDLLVLKRDSERLYAYPGPCRIKLFPAIAGAVLAEMANGVAMNPLTPKLVIPLAPDQHCCRPVPLRAIYVLSPPSPRSTSKRVTIRRLSQRRAFLAMLQNTFNCRVLDPERLKRQFAMAAQLAQSIPIKRLSYPRNLSLLPLAREAVLADLEGYRNASGRAEAATLSLESSLVRSGHSEHQPLMSGHVARN